MLELKHTQFTFYWSVQEEEGKAVLERSAIDPLQRLTHNSFSTMHDTSARIKRNFLIKTKIPLCLRTFFPNQISDNLYASIGHSKCPCCLHLFCSQCCHPVYGSASTACTHFLCFIIMRYHSEPLLENDHTD